MDLPPRIPSCMQRFYLLSLLSIDFKVQVLKNDLHLEIVDFEKDPELNEIINEYYDGVSEYIKNHNFKLFFHTRLFI